MSKVLTKEIADEWIADEDSHDLCEFEAIDDAAAESLSKHKGELGLGDLTELSDAAIESLSNHKGGINEEDPREWAEEFRANQ